MWVNVTYGIMQWFRNHANGGFWNALSHIGNSQNHSVKDNGEYESEPVSPESGFYTGKHMILNLFSYLHYVVVDWKTLLW